MHTPTPDEARGSDNVLAAFSLEDVADNGEDIAPTVVVFTLCDIDIPCVLRDGELYCEASLQSVFDAFAASISEGLRDLEDRVSKARGSALAFDGLQRSLFSARLVVPRVVFDREER